jgi:hypothetical protein
VRKIRDWIGKQVARYEHGARRLQLFFWAIIAINTFIGIVWGILPLELVLLFYAIGGIGVLIFGYISHKVKVGQSIIRAQFDIETKELYQAQINWGYAKLEKFRRMTDEELDANIAYWGKRLKIEEVDIEWED